MKPELNVSGRREIKLTPKISRSRNPLQPVARLELADVPATTSLGREGYVRPREPISTHIIQQRLVTDLEVVRCATSDQVRIGLQRCCLEVRRERNGGGHNDV